MEVIFEFKPLRSFCGVALSSISAQSANSFFGEPNEVEKPENNAFGEASSSYHFNTPQFSLFFDHDHLTCVAVSDPSFKLFGEQIMDLDQDELIYLFKKNGFSDHEIDTDWGEKQLIFDSAGITVFFDNQKISEIFIDA